MWVGGCGLVSVGGHVCVCVCVCAYSMMSCAVMYTYMQDKSSLPVRQFQFTGWPEESGKTPEHGADLIDLIGQVQKWQRTAGDRPVVVHCRCDSRILPEYCQDITRILLGYLDATRILLL